MSARGVLVGAAVAALAFAVWRAELFTVSRPGERPRPLELIAPGLRAQSEFDVTLPAVPVGMERLTPGSGVLVLHYWAPWERHGLLQAQLLDSLRRSEELGGLRVVVVCFDPFPSVARFVGRNRLRLPVLLDGRRQLRGPLPCPSLPYTYVIDAGGRIAVTQPGEVDWLAPDTRRALRALLIEQEEAGPRRSAISSGT